MQYGFYVVFCRAFTCSLVPMHNLDRLRYLSNITGVLILRMNLCNGRQEGFRVVRNSIGVVDGIVHLDY